MDLLLSSRLSTRFFSHSFIVLYRLHSFTEYCAILCFWMATDSARATVPLECRLLQASRPAVRTGNFSGGMRLEAGKPCLVDRFHQLRTTPVVCFQTQATSNSNTSRSCEEWPWFMFQDFQVTHVASHSTENTIDNIDITTVNTTKCIQQWSRKLWKKNKTRGIQDESRRVI